MSSVFMVLKILTFKKLMKFSFAFSLKNILEDLLMNYIHVAIIRRFIA